MSHVHLPLTPTWLLWPQPWVWVLLLFLVLPLLWRRLLSRRRRVALRYSDLSTVRAVAPRWQRYTRYVLPLLRIVALAGLIIAAARPQVAEESHATIVDGVALEMVIDTSWSMHDTDLSPANERVSRLEMVKRIFRQFVAGGDDLPGRPNDLIGIIRFATYADGVCPLTLDRDALLQTLDDVQIPTDRFGQPLDDARNTAIGDGLALAVERLKDLRRTTGTGREFSIRSRAIVLLTDGENNTGRITPREAGELAALFGIRVYTILAGTGQNLGPRRLPVNDSDLRWIAAVTGGRHFHATDRATLEEVYREIDALEPSHVEEQRYVTWHDLAGGWLVLAFTMLTLHALLDATWLRRLP